MALIESLRLNKGEQQDAAEFSKLFLDMIANELSKQKDQNVRSLTENMVSASRVFRGRDSDGSSSKVRYNTLQHVIAVSPVIVTALFSR
jgi:ubiquitin C-terminal hydrolase